MPAPNQGTFTFAGIQSAESISFVDCSGVAPARGTMRVYPQLGYPAQDSDLVFFYNGVPIVTIANCHIDSVDFDVGSGGQVATIHFVDERWTWKTASITGKYNFRLPNNWVDPNHEKTPQQLAALCFQALDVTNFDVSQVPNDARPEVDWDRANPAQELEKLCGDLGCRIVPQRSTGGWIIWQTGFGKSLPDGYPFEDWGEGAEPKQIPDYIKIVTGQIRYEISIPIKARGKDFDLAFKPLRQLSYAPSPDEYDSGFGLDPWGFQFLAGNTIKVGAVKAWNFGQPVNLGGQDFGGATRQLLPDGTKISAIELAQDSIFRCWSPDFTNAHNATQLPNGDWGMRFPFSDNLITVRQLILTDKLIRTYTDILGVEHERAAFVWGNFFGKRAESGNYPPGTRIDKQWSSSIENRDERASFSLAFDPLDTTRSIITTSSPMVLKIDSAATKTVFWPANLFFMCACNIRDPVTWQPYRYEYMYQIGNGTNTDFCEVVHQEDIQPWVAVLYNSDGSLQTAKNGQSLYRTNVAEVNQQCLYYAQAKAREYQNAFSQRRTYIGFYPIDMDGLIQQITYEIGERGTSMIASQGSEHSWYTPDFLERRQQIARRGISEMIDYARYEARRRLSTKGTFNT